MGWGTRWHGQMVLRGGPGEGVWSGGWTALPTRRHEPVPIPHALTSKVRHLAACAEDHGALNLKSWSQDDSHTREMGARVAGVICVRACDVLAEFWLLEINILSRKAVEAQSFR